MPKAATPRQTSSLVSVACRRMALANASAHQFQEPICDLGGSILICSAVADVEATAAPPILKRLLQQQNPGNSSAVNILVEVSDQVVLVLIVQAAKDCNFVGVVLSPALPSSVQCVSVLSAVACGDMAFVPLQIGYPMAERPSVFVVLAEAFDAVPQILAAGTDKELMLSAMCDLLFGEAKEFDVRSSSAAMVSQA